MVRRKIAKFAGIRCIATLSCGAVTLLACMPRRELSSYLGGTDPDAGEGWVAPVHPQDAGAPASPGTVRDAGDVEDAAASAGVDSGTPTLTCRGECACEARDGLSFMFCGTPVGRAVAAQRCVAAGGALVSIEDGELNVWLSERMSDISADDFWTGGTDAQTEGVWQWSDGRVFYEVDADAAAAFTAWDEGQPNDLNGEDCMRSVEALWRDLDCADEIGYVCER